MGSKLLASFILTLVLSPTIVWAEGVCVDALLGRDKSWLTMQSQRLVNPQDYQKAIKDGIEPYLAYGYQTIEDWIYGLQYSNSVAPEVAVNVSLLQEIHRNAAARLKFHGFEGRRILQKFRSGAIDRDQMSVLLEQAYKEDREVSGVSHSTLAGKIRTDSIDEIEHRGSSFDEKGKRYFTVEELKEIRKNRFMTVDEFSIRRISSQRFQGLAYYSAVSNVSQNLNQVFHQFNRDWAKFTSQEKRMRLIFQLERDLISIHPFLDGNGRSIRLLSDLLLKRIGVNPPLYPVEIEISGPFEQFYKAKLEAIRSNPSNDID